MQGETNVNDKERKRNWERLKSVKSSYLPLSENAQDADVLDEPLFPSLNASQLCYWDLLPEDEDSNPDS